MTSTYKKNLIAREMRVRKRELYLNSIETKLKSWADRLVAAEKQIKVKDKKQSYYSVFSSNYFDENCSGGHSLEDLGWVPDKRLNSVQL